MDKNKIYANLISVINECEIDMFKSDFFTEKSMNERIEQFSNEDGQLNLYQAMNFIFQETDHKRAILMARVLTELVDRGYLSFSDKFSKDFSDE